MGRTRKRNELVDTGIGQHLGLPIAAHLARTQLLSDPLNAYDVQHLRESVDLVAGALVRVAPLYVKEVSSDRLRQMSDAELEGATVKNGAETLALKDGRIFSAVSIRRTDLRQAIALLKTTGIPGLTRAPARRAERAAAGTADRMARLRASLEQLEHLLRLPLVPAEVERANKLAIQIARNAPNGHISNLAMRLMSVVHEARNGGDGANVRVMLARLRSAVDEISSAQSQ